MNSLSDSIVLIVPYETKVNIPNSEFHETFTGSMTLVHLLQNIQYDLLRGYRLLIRGYVSQGDIFLDRNNDIFLGEGFVNAVEGEKSIGGAPRIVIDPGIINDAIPKIENQLVSFKEKGLKSNHILKYLLEDRSDGHYFIDYLDYINILNNIIPEMDYDKEIYIIEDFIKNNIVKYTEGNFNIYSKYKWLESYFNRHKNMEMFSMHRLAMVK